MSWIMTTKIDRHCLAAASLFVISDVIALFAFIAAASNRDFLENINQVYSLDPTFIQKEWQWASNYTNVNIAYGIVNAMAWFVFSIPIVKVAWIQSNFGTRKMGLHISVVVLALGGSFSELLSRLLALGSNNALAWMASRFNLDDWNVMVASNSTTNGNLNDEIGWRTLQMIDIAMSGLLLWIDAVEYLFLAGIFILLAFSIRTDNQLFGKRWAKLGVLMAVLGIIEFAFAILRFENWGLFSTLGALINIINQLVLFPVWLVWLGRQLPKAEEERNSTKNATANANSVTESSDSMLT